MKRLVSLVLVLACALPPALARAADDESSAEIDAAVAKSLFEQGVKLYHAGQYADARELFLESYARSPKGPYASSAREMIGRCNVKLGITDPLPPVPPADNGDGAPLDPYGGEPNGGGGGSDESPQNPYLEDGGAKEPADGGAVENPYADDHSPRATADRDDLSPAPLNPYTPEPPSAIDTGRDTGGAVESRQRVELSGGAYGLGMGIELMAAARGKGGGAVLGTLALTATGAYAGWWIGKHHHVSEGELLATDSLTTWGMAEGLWIAHVANASTGHGYGGGALIGSLAGLGTGYWIATSHPTPGHVALANSLAGYGTYASLMIGVMIRPVQNRAYSLNAVLGSGAGLIAGALLARDRDVSRERMAWIDLGVAAGAAAGWVVDVPFAKSAHASQIGAGLSIVGMAVGGWLGVRMTRHLHHAHVSGGPSAVAGIGALVARDETGRWSVGVPIVHPLAVEPRAGGAADLALGVDLVSGRF